MQIHTDLLPKTVNRQSPVNIYIQYCATYTPHLLLRAGILVPSQGSTLHNSFCRRTKIKKKNRMVACGKHDTKADDSSVHGIFFTSINIHIQ